MILLKLQQTLVPHPAQLLGEGTAVQIEVVRQLLAVERNVKFQPPAGGGLRGK